MNKEKFDKRKYDAEFKKKNYKHFIVDITIKEMEELNILLNRHNLTKAQFLRNSINELKKKWVFFIFMIQWNKRGDIDKENRKMYNTSLGWGKWVF